MRLRRTLMHENGSHLFFVLGSLFSFHVQIAKQFSLPCPSIAQDKITSISLVEHRGLPVLDKISCGSDRLTGWGGVAECIPYHGHSFAAPRNFPLTGWFVRTTSYVS